MHLVRIGHFSGHMTKMAVTPLNLP